MSQVVISKLKYDTRIYLNLPGSDNLIWFSDIRIR